MAAERAGGVGSGGARRRREWQLRSWWRHEQRSVAAAPVSASSHHSAQPGERLESHFAPRGQTNTGAHGRRRAALKEPGPPQLEVVRAASPRTAGPSLATPSLSDVAADVLDSSSLRFLTAAALTARRKEEEEEKKAKKEAAKRQEVQAEAAEAMQRARLLVERNKRKRKKRKKKKLPRTYFLRSSCLARQRVRVHASVFAAALLRDAWFKHVFSRVYRSRWRRWWFRLWTSTLTFQFLEVVITVSLQIRVPQRLPQFLLDTQFKGGFGNFPTGKSARVARQVGAGVAAGSSSSTPAADGWTAFVDDVEEEATRQWFERNRSVVLFSSRSSLFVKGHPEGQRRC